MSSSLTRTTAFRPPDDPLVWPTMSLEGRASRFHCGLGERLVSARLARCPSYRRRLLNGTDNGRSAGEAGTGLDAPNRTLAGANEQRRDRVRVGMWRGCDRPGMVPTRVSLRQIAEPDML